jgi:hypothetical protein
VQGSKERASYELFTANFKPISTNGRRTLRLNLEVRWGFTWRFMVASVQLPIIGVDLLATFSLLVDCRNKIPEGITLSAPAQTASTHFGV